MRRSILYLLPILLLTTINSVTAQTDLLENPLNSFNVQKKNDKIQISWRANAVKCNNFLIERSYNGKDWSCVAMVMGDFIDADSDFVYSDKAKKSSKVYYRIIQKELTGAQSVSSIKSIE